MLVADGEHRLTLDYDVDLVFKSVLVDPLSLSGPQAVLIAVELVGSKDRDLLHLVFTEAPLVFQVDVFHAGEHTVKRRCPRLKWVVLDRSIERASGSQEGFVPAAGQAGSWAWARPRDV